MLDEIKSVILQFLDRDKWKYQVDPEKNVISTGIKLKGKFQSTRALIFLNDNRYTVLELVSDRVNELYRDEMAKLLTRINCGLAYGSFEMDYRDGSLRYKFSVDCDGCLPSLKVVQDSLIIPAMMLDQFCDMILGINAGMSVDEVCPLRPLQNPQKLS